MKKILLLLVFPLVFMSPVQAENISPAQIIQLMSAKYVNYCGNGDNREFEKGRWESVKDCLTDGRVHLVYEHDQLGKAVGDFDYKLDHSILIDAVNDGADIVVMQLQPGSDERSPVSIHCEAVMVKYDKWRGSDEDARKSISCSSTDILWPFYNKAFHVNSTAKLINSTSGHVISESYRKEASNRVLNEQLSVSKYEIEEVLTTTNKDKLFPWVKKIKWFVRY